MKRREKKQLVDNGDEALLLGLAADEIEIALLSEDEEDKEQSEEE